MDGGEAPFVLDLGAPGAGRPYLMLVSSAGTQPGTPFKECGSSSDESSRSNGGHRCRCAQYFYLKDSANNVTCHCQTDCNTLLSFSDQC